MMISDTVNLKGMSLSHMRHVTVLLVFSSKFTHVKMKGPNKTTQFCRRSTGTCTIAHQSLHEFNKYEGIDMKRSQAINQILIMLL